MPLPRPGTARWCESLRVCMPSHWSMALWAIAGLHSRAKCLSPGKMAMATSQGVWIAAPAVISRGDITLYIPTISSTALHEMPTALAAGHCSLHEIHFQCCPSPQATAAKLASPTAPKAVGCLWWLPEPCFVEFASTFSKELHDVADEIPRMICRKLLLASSSKPSRRVGSTITAIAPASQPLPSAGCHVSAMGHSICRLGSNKGQ